MLINIFSQSFIFSISIYLSLTSIFLIFFLFSRHNEYIDSNLKTGWSKTKYVKKIKYGMLCNSKIINSTYYDIPGVCSLKCDLIPVPFPPKSLEDCPAKRKVIEIRNDRIVALDDVKITFTNTYYSYSQSKKTATKYLKKGEESKIEYEYIKVESKDVDDAFLHFIPTKLNKNQRKTKQYNINIYLFDGLSRSMFNEQMNETVLFLNSIINEFDIFEFYRYHSIELNSRPNYIPIFYGTTERRAFWLNEKDDIFEKNG